MYSVILIKIAKIYTSLNYTLRLDKPFNIHRVIKRKIDYCFILFIR